MTPSCQLMVFDNDWQCHEQHLPKSWMTFAYGLLRHPRNAWGKHTSQFRVFFLLKANCFRTGQQDERNRWLLAVLVEYNYVWIQPYGSRDGTPKNGHLQWGPLYTIYGRTHILVWWEQIQSNGLRSYTGHVSQQPLRFFMGWWSNGTLKDFDFVAQRDGFRTRCWPPFVEGVLFGNGLVHKWCLKLLQFPYSEWSLLHGQTQIVQSQHRPCHKQN